MNKTTSKITSSSHTNEKQTRNWNLKKINRNQQKNKYMTCKPKNLGLSMYNQIKLAYLRVQATK